MLSMQSTLKNRQTYVLYPAAEACIIDPLGIKISWYALPERPTMGFERGSMLSSDASRRISGTEVCTRNVSWNISLNNVPGNLDYRAEGQRTLITAFR